MVDRLQFVRELPPLNPEQRKKLLTDILPPGHKLTEEHIQEVVERVQGGSIRLLQGMGGMITNCARVGEKMVPPTKEHVLEALAYMQEPEREKEGAAARSGLAAPATTAATALVASPAPAAAHDGAEETDDEEARNEARALPRALPSHPTHTRCFFLNPEASEVTARRCQLGVAEH